MAALATMSVSTVAAASLAPVARSQTTFRRQAMPAALPLRASSSRRVSRVVMSAQPERREQNIAEKLVLPTTVALAAMTLVPEFADAAPAVSSSLKNLLLSVVGGGVVLAAIGVAVYGVAAFDPVKRR